MGVLKHPDKVLDPHLETGNQIWTFPKPVVELQADEVSKAGKRLMMSQDLKTTRLKRRLMRSQDLRTTRLERSLTLGDSSG